MKIEKIVLILIISVILTVGCATVKENKEENVETEETENNNNVIDYGSFQETITVDDFGDTIRTYKGDQTAILKHIMGDDYQSEFNDFCKRNVSVFPNPTSSSATINIKRMAGGSFQYKLIFDEKIIYEDNILMKLNVENQIVIPAHLIQKEGTYIVAYEIGSSNISRCQGTVQFIVMKNK